MFFRIQRPQDRGGPHEIIFKGLIYSFFPKNGPGVGRGVLPDFTRRGTNYLHTTLLKTYAKSNFLESESIFFEFSARKIVGVLTKTFSKSLISPFFFKKWPRGRGRFTRFHKMWH